MSRAAAVIRRHYPWIVAAILWAAEFASLAAGRRMGSPADRLISAMTVCWTVIVAVRWTRRRDDRGGGGRVVTDEDVQRMERVCAAAVAAAMERAAEGGGSGAMARRRMMKLV